MQRAQQAETFRALHNGDRPLLLANVWDPLGAAIVASAGFPAVATASAAVALSRGFDDGEKITIDELAELVERIAGVVEVPISVDFERGYGPTAAEVGESTARLLNAGAVGVNIEDSLEDGALRNIDEQCERIHAVRLAGRAADVPIFINARTDAFMLGQPAEEGITRLEAYAAAGADGIYPILCADPNTLAEIHNVVFLPINVLLTPSLPPLADLVAAGVRRISLGPGLLGIAAGAVDTAVRQLLSGKDDLSRFAAMSTFEMRKIMGIPE